MKPWVKYFLTGLVAFVLGVAASGSGTSSTKTVTETQTSESVSEPATQTVTRTVTHRVRVRPRPQQPQQAKVYSGNGGKSLGTLRFPNGATLKWTNDGGIMQILSEGPDPVPVNSQAHA